MTTPHPLDEDSVRLAQARRRRLLRTFAPSYAQTTLQDLQTHFQTHLPAFQGTAGHYDPLDAMRRDAYREVFLYISHQLSLAQQENTNQTTQSL